jgi:phage shock protein PspC (stress-responsive transcriptional regulator)
MSVADEIQKLAQLRDAGTLSAEEFERAKARLLGGHSVPPAEPYAAVAQRPFRRSTTDVWLGGVCGGLGEFTGLESWVWRLLFVLGLIFGGFSLVPYLLLWIFVPRGV